MNYKILYQQGKNKINNNLLSSGVSSGPASTRTAAGGYRFLGILGDNTGNLYHNVYDEDEGKGLDSHINHEDFTLCHKFS